MSDSQNVLNDTSWNLPFDGEETAIGGVCSFCTLVGCSDTESTVCRYVSLFGTGVDADTSDTVSTCNGQG